MSLCDTLCEPVPIPRSERNPSEELWRRYRKSQPGSNAEDQLVRRYLPLVKTVVGRLAMTLPPHVDLDDLYSSGLVGLLSAIRQYDHRSGSSFETYARVRVRGAMLDELRRLDWVPRSIHDKARKIQAVIQDLEQQTGSVPTPAQVARALNLTEAEYEQLLQEIRPATFVCLDAAPSADSAVSHSPYESIPDVHQENPVDTTARRELSRLIAERLDQLPEMQRKVLALYYFEDMRLREIAEAYGLTESRICQIHAQAILNIKTYLHKRENSGRAA
jgi:RNA polymerase sigma factor for flagellar operon FliA